jgi:hypothetical protein
LVRLLHYTAGMRGGRFRVWSIVGMGLALGCGREVTAPAEPEPTNTAPPPVESMPDPGRVLGPADEEDPTTKPGAATGHGIVTLFTTTAGTGGIADFWKKPASAEKIDADKCRLELHSDPPARGKLSAGDIKFTPSWVLEFVPGTGYPSTFFAPGAPGLDLTIGVDAEGDVVPTFFGPIDPVGLPTLTTDTAAGVDGEAAFDVAWAPIPNATTILVRLAGAVATVVCITKAPASHFLVPEARVREVAASPISTPTCSSCLDLTVTGRSTVSIRSVDYDISLRHEATFEASLAVQ